MPLQGIFRKLLARPSDKPYTEVIRYRIVLKYLGVVLLVLGVEFAITAAVSIEMAEHVSSYIFYLVMAVIYSAAGLYLFYRVPEKEITVPEVAAVAASSFLVASVLGAAPFAVLGAMPPVDAWFESMSGFTTTGFSLMDVKGSPGSLVFMRALSQWLGGMGFVVITVSILIVSRSTAVTLLKEGVEEKLFPRISRHIQVIVLTYAALSIIGVVMLLLFGLGLFDALCYTLSGLSTGGFAPDAGSVSVQPYRKALLPLILIMSFGATNFILYYENWKVNRGIRKALYGFFTNSQVLCLIFFILALAVLIGATLTGEATWLDGLFMAASAQTTTGFFTVDPAGFSDVTLMLLVPAMFIGGAMGSTAGGIKFLRIVVFFKSFNRFIFSREYPEELVLPKAGGVKGVAKGELQSIFYVIAVYVFFAFSGSLVFIASGFEPMKSIFEVTSAVGTVGLSSGIVSPELNGGLKVLLVLLMWGGRLEFIPVFVWLYSFTLRFR